MTKTCSVRIVTPQEYPTWDDLIQKSAQGSIFLRSDFLTMLSETDPTLMHVMLGCYSEEGELKAAHAILYRKVAGISIPPGSPFFYNGPVLPPDRGLPRAAKAEEDCVYLMALAAYLSKHFPYIPFDTHPSLLDLRPLFRLKWKAQLRYTYIWKLTEFKDLLKKMRQGERKKVRKAQQLFNFKTERWSDMAPEFLPIYQKFVRSYKTYPDENKLRILSRQMQWMEDHNLCLLVTARTHDGRLRGALITFFSYEDETAYFWRLAYEVESLKDGIAPGLYYTTLEMIATVIKYADTAEAMSPGLENFKDYLGTDLVPYYSVTSPNNYKEFFSFVRNIKWRLSGMTSFIRHLGAHQ